MNIVLTHDCKEELRELDLRATPTRVAILKYIESVDEPIDVASIITYLKTHNVDADPATIFRIVNMFTDRGLIRQIQLNEGKFRYELSSKAEHHHFICESCGVIEDISDCKIDLLEKEIEKKKHIKVKRHALEFFGVCRECQP